MYKIARLSESPPYIYSAGEPIIEPPPAGFQAGAGKSVSVFLVRYAVLEFFAVAIVSYLTSLIYSEVAWSDWMAGQEAYLISAILLATGVLVVSLSSKHHAAFQTQPNHRVLWNALTTVALTFSFFLSGLFLLKVATDYSRATFLFQLFTVSAAVLGARVVAHARIRAAIANGRVEARRAIIIGAGEELAAVARQLGNAGVAIVQSLSFPTRSFAANGGKMDSAELRRMIETCRALKPDDVVIMTAAAHLPRSGRLAEFLSELPVSVHLVPVDTGVLLASARLGELGTLTTVELFRSPLSLANRVIKRFFDIVAAGVGILLLWPLLLLVAIAIKLDSRGPILFGQTRHGYNNETIRVLKFRTMTLMEDGHAFRQAKKNDPRVTRIGRFLRRSNIDELPQLLNVLAGDMSIVGPRPHPVAMNQSFEQHIVPLSRRHKMKPGITGWAQVNGHRGETDTIEKMQCRFECDIHYIDNWSFLLDLKIILMTLFSRAAYRNAF